MHIFKIEHAENSVFGDFGMIKSVFGKKFPGILFSEDQPWNFGTLKLVIISKFRLRMYFGTHFMT